MTLPSIFRGHPMGALGDPTDPFGSLGRTMDWLFEGLWRDLGAQGAAAPGGFVPRVDVVEREDELLVSAELPGLEEKDFQLEIHGDVLTLRGEKRDEHAEAGRGWRWSERSYGSFRRAIRLPVEVDSTRSSASYRDGVLTVTLPKAESARVRHIPVNPA
jgi:HSP20 family protein